MRRLRRSADDPTPPVWFTRTPCKSPPPQRHELPPTSGAPLGLALSGGGWRATLVGVGALRFLAEASILSELRHLTSVSGGSIAAGLEAANWAELAEAHWSLQAFDSLITTTAIQVTTAKPSLAARLARGMPRRLRGHNSTMRLAEELGEIIGRAHLGDLPRGCWFEVNATNLTTGARFRMSRDIVGDYITGSVESKKVDLTLPKAVAASCGVPGVFPPTVVSSQAFPCADGQPILLVDGGVVDNLGLDALKPSRPDLPGLISLVVDAGATFSVSGHLGRSVAGPIGRSVSIALRQSSGTRSRWLIERFNEPSTKDRGALFNMQTQMRTVQEKTPELQQWLEHDQEPSIAEIYRLSQTPTTFSSFNSEHAAQLVERGRWLMGAVVAQRQPQLISRTEPREMPK